MARSRAAASFDRCSWMKAVVIANTTIVRLGTEGKVCLVASSTTNAIVDVSGYLVDPP